jgi:hypothetical protein
LSIGYFKKIPAKNKPLSHPLLTAPGQFSTPSWLGKRRMMKKSIFLPAKGHWRPGAAGNDLVAAKGGSG